MIIKVEHDKLVAVLEKAASVAASKGKATFLQAIWLSATEHGELQVEVTDSQLEYKGKCDCEVGTPGKAGASRHLYDLVRKLPGGEMSLSVDDAHNMVVRSGRRKYTLPVYDPSWYQPVSVPDSDMSKAPAAMIRDMLGHTSWAASPDPVDESMHLVNIELLQDSRAYRSWALDGHKLAMFTGLEIDQTISLGELEKSGRVPIAKNHAQALLKMLPKKPISEMGWAIDHSRMYVRSGDGTHCLSAPLSTHQAPNVDALLDKTRSEYKMTIWVDQLLEALDRISVFTSDTQRSAQLRWTDSTCLEISIASQDKGRACEVVVMDGCTVDPKQMDGLTMPVKEWQSVIKQLKSDFEVDTLEMNFSDRNGPVVHHLSGPERGSMRVLLMPMTAKEDEETYYEE